MVDQLSMREAALAAHDAGLCVVPPREDGSKAPINRWKEYQAERPLRPRVESWYGSRTGLGIVCGEVSGGLELFEFDDRETYQQFKAVAKATGLGDLVDRLESGYLEDTPGGGFHTFYRCTEISGNTKLARRPKKPEEMEHPKDTAKVLIETRGSGGFAIIAPSAGKVHPSGKPYQLLSGGVNTIITITPEERGELWDLARSFDQMEKRPAGRGDKKTTGGAKASRPGDDYNERANWAEILGLHGWVNAYERGGTTYWRRPGKEVGVSATTNYQGSGLLYVFSTSTDFEPERGYNRFAAHAVLEHGGDFNKAARALRHQGYGKPGPGSLSDDPGARYEMAEDGIVWNKPLKDGDVPVYLTNFTVEITAQLIEDDGVETKRSLEIEAKMQDRTSRFTVGAAQFGGMGWAMEHLGAQAVVYPGNTLKDHARTAIQLLSKDALERHVYTHTGWRKQGEDWVFLHAGGAIGANGSLPGVEVHLPGDLRNYMLPEPPRGAELVQAIRASLRVLELADDAITVPIIVGPYRAALGAIDATIHLSGPTGEGKSEAAALAQQHFGPGMDARHLPGSWSSTGNALEGLAFSAKDVLLVVDDFAPTGSATDVQRMHREADRLLRAQGNSSGRMRMRADATLKPAKPPRGLILSTGEDVPKGQSLRARMLVIETGKDALDWDKLTACQEDAANGLYAQAMAGYVRSLASRYQGISDSLKAEVDELRAEAHQSGQHRRTADLVANLGVGFRHFLVFAQESSAVTQDEADGLWQRCWRALGEAAEAQAAHQRAAEPTTRFLELLSAAIVSGRAHVTDKDGEKPKEWMRWGWREWEIGIGKYMRIEWRPQGQQVGWIDGQDLYLEADAAYAEAQKLARDGGDSLTVMLPTLKRRLKERGLLASTTQAAGREWLDVRRTLQGQRRKVLHLDSNSLVSPERDQWSQSGDGSYLADSEMAPNDGSKTDNRPEFWSPEMEPNKGAAISEEGDEGSNGSNGSKTEHIPKAKAKRRLSL